MAPQADTETLRGALDLIKKAFHAYNLAWVNLGYAQPSEPLPLPDTVSLYDYELNENAVRQVELGNEYLARACELYSPLLDFRPARIGSATEEFMLSMVLGRFPGDLMFMEKAARNLDLIRRTARALPAYIRELEELIRWAEF